MTSAITTTTSAPLSIIIPPSPTLANPLQNVGTLINPITTTTSSLSTRSVSTNPSLCFKPVLGEGREQRLEIVRHFFNTILDRIYGSQASALAKIETLPSDRTCRLMYDGKIPVGLLVVKKAPTDEFFLNSLEIKTLAVLNTAPSRRGYGSALLNKAEEIAKEAQANSIHVTVNSTVPESLAFFKNKGFVETRSLSNLGKEGTRESLFVKMLGKESVSAKQDLSTAPATHRDTKDARLSTKRKSPERNPSDSRTAPREPARSYANPSTEQRTMYTAKRTFHQNPARPIEATLKPIYVKQIKDGSKSVEVRINAGMFRNLQVGQPIRFFCGGWQKNEVNCKIAKINTYGSFEETLEKEGYKKCLPEARSLQDAIRTYHAIPSFTERAEKSGVVAIHLERV